MDVVINIIFIPFPYLQLGLISKPLMLPWCFQRQKLTLKLPAGCRLWGKRHHLGDLKDFRSYVTRNVDKDWKYTSEYHVNLKTLKIFSIDPYLLFLITFKLSPKSDLMLSFFFNTKHITVIFFILLVMKCVRIVFVLLKKNPLFYIKHSVTTCKILWLTWLIFWIIFGSLKIIFPLFLDSILW